MSTPRNNAERYDRQKLILVGSVATVVVVGVVYRRKINTVKTITAATAVQNWIDKNEAAGFTTYLFDRRTVEAINAATGNALPTAV